jgi:bacterioferritin-associated ferredoxin
MSLSDQPPADDRAPDEGGTGLYVCFCARVRECEIRAAIGRGARSEDAVAEDCGAGTGCGTCRERIDELIGERAPADTLAGISR